jgi:hypothetical protein
MVVILVHQGKGLTRQGYEEVVGKLTDGRRGRMESPEDWPVEGILVYAAGDAPGGFRVVDVWESE